MIDSKQKDKIIKIVLVIIIIILLLHNCYMINKNKKEMIPTGNVDIIEIKCDKEDTCEVKPQETIDENNTEPVNKNDDNNYSKKENLIINTTEKTKENEHTISKDNEPTPVQTPEPEELIIKDKEIRWLGSTTAKIFSSSMYELGDKIAPESSNVYQFIVRNGTFYNLKYEVNFIENNPYNINMKYKLKKNNKYIIDHYVSANELNINEILLDSKTNDTYYLEWKWISSENDTEIGTNPDATYELKIEIKAESTNE